MRSSAIRNWVFFDDPTRFYVMAGCELPYVVPAADWRDGLGIDEDGELLTLEEGQSLVAALPVQFRDARIAVLYRKALLEQ